MDDSSKKQFITSKYDDQNTWVSLIRIFMCFVVINVHFTPAGNTVMQKLIGGFGSIAAPCFMFLSFFLMAKDIRILNIEKLKARLLRLYVPIFV